MTHSRDEALALLVPLSALWKIDRLTWDGQRQAFHQPLSGV